MDQKGRLWGGAFRGGGVHFTKEKVTKFFYVKFSHGPRGQKSDYRGPLEGGVPLLGLSQKKEDKAISFVFLTQNQSTSRKSCTTPPLYDALIYEKL